VAVLEQILDTLTYQPGLDGDPPNLNRYFKKDKDMVPMPLITPLDATASKGALGYSHDPSRMPDEVPAENATRKNKEESDEDEGASQEMMNQGLPAGDLSNYKAASPEREGEGRGRRKSFSSVRRHTSELHGWIVEDEYPHPSGSEGMDDWDPPGMDGRDTQSRGNRSAAISRMRSLGSNSELNMLDSRSGATTPLTVTSCEGATVAPSIGATPVLQLKHTGMKYQRWTVEDIFAVGDQITNNDELSVIEITAHLYNTEYDGFARHLTRHMCRFDKNRDGVLAKKEIRWALQEYVSKVLPQELEQKKEAEKTGKLGEGHYAESDQIAVIYGSVEVHTTEERLLSFRSGLNKDWHAVVLKPSPLWSYKSGNRTSGLPMGKDEVLQVMAMRHIDKAMSKILHDGHWIGQHSFEMKHASCVTRTHQPYEVNLIHDFHTHSRARHHARVAGLQKLAASRVGHRGKGGALQ